jgi:2-polyprenyl-3-methyl-5-hydroxy-6-metoxy-1,4-benzoquinol methylase
MKFQFVRRRLSVAAPRILDIGCGNHSPTTTKRWFPGCHYSGADIQQYNNSEADLAAMDAFYPVGLDGSGYEAIPDNSFDFVILNHVIEHMAPPPRADCERTLLKAQTGRVHLDCVSLSQEPFVTVVNGRNAAFL